MSSPAVSVVLPTYNGAKYLRGAIESCIAQTFEDWELIIVDDASSDDAPHIIREYVSRDPRIRSVRNSTNQRLPGSLNVGFALARGRYLSWTSDDNCYRPNAFRDLGWVLDDRPDVGVVYAQYCFLEDDGTAGARGWAGPLKGLPFGNVIGACFMYRKSVQESLGGYQEDLFLGEDYDFWLRASTRFAFHFLDAELYDYRRHAASLSVTRRDAIKLVHEQCLVRNLPEMRWMGRDLSRRAFSNLVQLAVARSDRRAGWRYLAFASRHHLSIAFSQSAATCAFLAIPLNLDTLAKRFGHYRWQRRLRRALHEIEAVVPRDRHFALLDQAALGNVSLTGRSVVRFLEREGRYFGLPSDDANAIEELELLRGRGVSHFVIAWPSYWCLEYYRLFFDYLESRYRRVVRTDRVWVFELAALSTTSAGANGASCRTTRGRGECRRIDESLHT